MKNILTIIALSALTLALKASPDRSYRICSPDGKNNINIILNDTLYWSVERNSHLLIAPSPITMTIGETTWGTGIKRHKKEYTEESRIIAVTVPRKYSELNETYKGLKIILPDYTVEFRAYNDGVAYRFISTKDCNDHVTDENVSFCLADNYLTYTLLTGKLQNWYEEQYTIKRLSELPDTLFSINPVMIDAGSCKMLLADANLENYPGLYLRPDGQSFRGVLAKYPAEEKIINGGNKKYVTQRSNYLVKRCGKRSFPWRVAGLFDTDADILKSDLVYILSDGHDPKTDYTWIKPGKVLWDWWNGRNIYKVDFRSGVNTSTYMYMIDFAASNNIEYLLIDEGWSEKNDLTILNPAVDMPAICEYAGKKNVGIILWAKWINLERQMDEAYELMASWGVKGIKIDFMDRNDARMVRFFHESAAKAAEHQMLVDYHGSYPCKGERRKYPNMMTREGLIGLEYNKFGNKYPSPEHDLIIPFTRMWAGPMDYTPGAMLNGQPGSYFKSQKEPMSMGTRCHQLAMYIIYESPLQMISDSPTKYNENPECLNFISNVPVTWDITIPIEGKIAEYLVVARKKGDKWYIGAMNNRSRDIEIDLSFLEKGDWSIESFSDGINAELNGKDYKIKKNLVNSSSMLNVHLAPGGGFAAVISR